MKITDIQIDVIKHELAALTVQTGIESGQTVEHGVSRVLTDEGIEGNGFVGA